MPVGRFHKRINAFLRDGRESGDDDDIASDNERFAPLMDWRLSQNTINCEKSIRKHRKQPLLFWLIGKKVKVFLAFIWSLWVRMLVLFSGSRFGKRNLQDEFEFQSSFLRSNIIWKVLNMSLLPPSYGLNSKTDCVFLPWGSNQSTRMKTELKIILESDGIRQAILF